MQCCGSVGKGFESGGEGDVLQIEEEEELEPIEQEVVIGTIGIERGEERRGKKPELGGIRIFKTLK